MKKISLITLGCPKNLVDTESMAALLGEEGYILTNFVEEADIVIINTCGFIRSAVEESESVIGKILENKGDKKVIVAGCLIQRYKEKVMENKGIDGIVGTGDPGKIVEAVEKVEKGEKVVLIEENTFITEKVYPRLISTYPYAYIKISEGCENFCKYCLIPKLRGPIRSRKIESIVEEAEKLVEMGYKEIILVAQDTTNYGKDFKDGTNLEKLLKELVKVDVKWIRIMYTHPAHIRDSLLKIIADEEKICKYIDIPLQHAHPEILEKMGRPVFDYRKLIERIRKFIPEVRIRTTFIVGFPGENEKHFKYLVDFIKEMEFDKLGCFPYSREKGTPAYDFENQIPEEIKEERRNIVMEIQREISKKKLKEMVGKKIEVLIENKQDKYYKGRTEYDAPEIDGIVYIKGKNLKTGKFYKVRIKKAYEYDLYGEI